MNATWYGGPISPRHPQKKEVALEALTVGNNSGRTDSSTDGPGGAGPRLLVLVLERLARLLGLLLVGRRR
jgi:hypothetical protein